jgi:hypothetical protein
MVIVAMIFGGEYECDRTGFNQRITQRERSVRKRIKTTDTASTLKYKATENKMEESNVA